MSGGEDEVDDGAVDAAARDLGALVARHPVVLRLKRLEEQIREDEGLRVLWEDLQEAENQGSGCGSGGCGSGGCGSGCGSGDAAAPVEGEGPVMRTKRNGGPKPGERMELYRQFSDAPVLQEYIQVRHQFYLLVDRLYETVFETMYGKPWAGVPELQPLEEEAPRVGFAGVSLVDVLDDDEDLERASG